MGGVDAMTDLLYTCDVNQQVRDGSTASHAACMLGHVEETRLLLSVFAKTDITDGNRRTPVMLTQGFGFQILDQYLRCTLTESRDNDPTSTRITDNNTDTVSPSSTEGVQQN